eukprot:NODE_97_length_20652_cov_0.832093.p16 type:complete len:123 gc:universal NODE_97_length_20652_cov_0.832093:10749-11117(+)
MTNAIPKAAQIRLQKEYMSILRFPIDNISVKPDDQNLLIWYFVIQGPTDTPYFGGEYFGTIIFENNYPFSPPNFKMFTPNGRFDPGKLICMTNTTFHRDMWNPLWTIESMLIGLVSYMTSYI